MNIKYLSMFMGSILSLSILASESPKKLSKSLDKPGKSPRSSLSLSLPIPPKTKPIDIPQSSSYNRLRFSEKITISNSLGTTSIANFDDEDNKNPLSQSYTNSFIDNDDNHLLVFPYAFSEVGYTPSPRGFTPNSLKSSK